MELDLKQLTTPQLLAIRRVLTDGDVAFASKTETAELKELREYKTRNEILNERRAILTNLGINIDEDPEYWSGLSDSMFDFVVRTAHRLATRCQGQGSAKAEYIKVPQITAPQRKNAFDTALRGLQERRGDC